MSQLTPPMAPDNAFLIHQGQAHDVVWFVDYTDPATRRVRDLLLRSVERFAGMDLAFAVRLFPHGGAEDFGSTGGGADSDESAAQLAARAAIAAHEQGRFIDMHRALFDAPPDYTEQSVGQIAEDIGLDLSRFKAALYAQETTDRLAADIASARASAQIPHTPMLFIDDVLFDGAWDEEALIEAIERPLGVRLQIASGAFFTWAASSGLVLVAATLVALGLVNFGFHDQYEHLRETIAGISVGDWSLSLPLEVWVNDGLMALFFLLVGIEIKRELVDGELSSPQQAALPLIAALGGMVVPAGIFVLFNAGTPSAHGWGVPMATDIAFTLGILAMLGDRVPTSLKVFVSALAIADDLGAIVVIALFYGHGFHMDAFIAAAAIFAVMIALNLGKVYARTPYMILGVVLWYFVYQSGLHATLAGVLTAAAIPTRPAAQIEGVAAQARKIFDYESARGEAAPSTIGVLQLQKIIERLRDPGFHLQHRLENWSSYFILPLFAFFNTGILIVGAHFDLFAPEVLGTMLGLVVGKPLGICLFVLLAIRLKLGRLSSEIDWQHMIGAGCLCGIGFTMSIFIASAAFAGDTLQSVKLAILLSSLIAASLGTVILLRRKPSVERSAA